MSLRCDFSPTSESNDHCEKKGEGGCCLDQFSTGYKNMPLSQNSFFPCTHSKASIRYVSTRETRDEQNIIIIIIRYLGTIDGHRRRRPTGRLLLLLHSGQVGPWLSRCRSPPPPRRPGPSKRSPCHSGKTAACPAAPAPATEPLALLNGGGGAVGAADASHARGVPAVPAGRLTALFRNGGKRETRDRGGASSNGK